MKFSFNSLKNQLFVSFLSLSFLFLGAFLVSIFYVKKINEAEQYKSKIEEIKDFTNSIIHLEMEFLNSVSVNDDYHRTGTSNQLNEISKKYAQLENRIFSIVLQKSPSFVNFNNELNSLKSNLETHRNLFIQIIDLEKDAGINGFGISAMLDESLLLLEKKNETISDAEILAIRSFEKDILMNNSYGVLPNFSQLLEGIKGRFAAFSNAKELSALKTYQDNFNALVIIKQELGTFNGSGLKSSLKRSNDYIFNNINQISQKNLLNISRFKSQIQITFIVTFIIFVAMSFILSYILAVVKSKPMEFISYRINQVMHDVENLEKIDDSGLKWASTELRYMVRSFNNLIEGLQNQFTVIDATNKTLRDNYNELKKVNHELDNFVYRVSHDLRAPLASVMGLINLSKSEKSIKGLQELLVMIDKSVKKLDMFIHEIIDLSRNSRLEIQHDSIQLYDLISEALESYAYMENACKIRKSVHVAQQIPFLSDEQRLKVILNNLISNSIRYYNPKQNSPVLNIEAEVTENSVEIIVYDNGNGIDKDYIEKIFDMFFRASHDSKGSGLGLYIVKETVNRLNGSIAVESEKRKYTKFTLTIPNLSGNVKKTIEESVTSVEA